MEANLSKPRIQNPAIGKRTSSSWSTCDSLAEESPHSPLRFHSPLHDPPDTPPYSSPIGSPLPVPADSLHLHSNPLVTEVGKLSYVSPSLSPIPLSLAPKKASAPVSTVETTMMVVAKAEGVPPIPVRKVGAGAGIGNAIPSSSGRGRLEDMVSVGEIGFRVSEMLFSLVSFSVMAADKTQGWAGDSFNRYKEYRYCLSVNIVAFVFSCFQAYDLGFYMATGKRAMRHYLSRHFNFFFDQALAYLLISASSSAATRANDWQSNWGKDKFTEMASASVVLSFLSFFAFAGSAILSGYNLCNCRSSAL